MPCSLQWSDAFAVAVVAEALPFTGRARVILLCDQEKPCTTHVSKAWDSVRLRTTSSQWNIPGTYPPYGELFFFLLEKEPLVLRELSRLGPSIRPHGELLLLLVQKEPTLVPDSEAFNSYIGDGFLIPELKDGSEASKDEQADSSSENNVGNGALFVIGLHGSGDAIARFLQDWEVAEMTLSCQKALDMLCQELHDVERRRGWFGF